MRAVGRRDDGAEIIGRVRAQRSRRDKAVDRALGDRNLRR
jgi:hypothetical protein